MPQLIQLVIRLASTTGMSEDTAENVVHCYSASGAVTDAGVENLCENFRDFYITTSGAQTTALSAYIGDSISRAANACQVLGYVKTDLDPTVPFGSPNAQVNFTMLASGSGTSFPEEVAAVISYNADLTNVPVTQANPTPPPATIRPQQRRRGRLFFGPLLTAAADSGTTVVRPSTTFRTNLGEAFKGLAAAFLASENCDLVVWSRADEAVYPVVGGYVDDAWGTQRRRGVEATVRTAFTIP